MCLTKFDIRSVENNKQNAGKISVFAPCGHCLSCEKKHQYAWGWRLTSEIQYCMKHKNYAAGFLTLTYNENSLPRLAEYGNIPCFDKEHTKTFINNVRKHCHRERGLKDIKYFLSSEKGPSTARPHYHLIIAWDRSIYTPEEMHAILKHYWADDLFADKKKKRLVRHGLGFICPKDPQGGESAKSGKVYKPFEIKCTADALEACFYAAKYVMKDFYFMRDLSAQMVQVENGAFFSERLKEAFRRNRRWMPHHLQSKSIGFESVVNLSDSEKLDLMFKGRALLGGDRLMLPPLYIQNKLLFSPCYAYKILPKGEPKRMVQREMTDFYKRNLKRILDAKISYLDKLFSKFCDASFWMHEGLKQYDSDDVAFVCSRFSRNLPFSLGTAYLVYYGMKSEYCFDNIYLTYLNRFRHSNYIDFRGKNQFNCEFAQMIDDVRIMGLGDVPKSYSSILLDFGLWKYIQICFNYIMSFDKFKKGEERCEEHEQIIAYLNQPLISNIRK